MKQILFLIAIGLILLTGCTGVKTLSTGLENDSFLVFIGNPSNYPSGIEVDIDNKIVFNAEVNTGNLISSKGTVYAISAGKHILTVSHNNNVIYKKQIFVSAQETKKIILP